MACENRQLQFFFFPGLSHGHMIPMVDMARLFASRGVKATIVTTPANATHVSKYMQRTPVNIITFKFPSAEANLPEGCEHVDTCPLHLRPNFLIACQKMQEPVDLILRDHRPDCLVADIFFSWATDVAGRYNIPRIVFQGTSFFSMCLLISVSLYKPFKTVASDSEPFMIPNLPDAIQMTRLQLPPPLTDEKFATLIEEATESELKSFGIIVNSFYELEPVYVEHFSNKLGRKAWHVGPLSLSISDIEEKSKRGNEATIDERECLKWLNSKELNSVIYISFGSGVYFSPSQLREIASALEVSEYQFIWVVRTSPTGSEAEPEDLFPEGFEKRTEEKGLVIRGWAPQVLILEHKAIGAFVTHCGWNSVLEAISAGVPMVTWPAGAEQFSNEKLLTQVLKIGISIGVKTGVGDSTVQSDDIVKAVKGVMTGEVAEEMRGRAKAFGDMATRAVEEGGSSTVSLDSLIREIASYGH